MNIFRQFTCKSLKKNKTRTVVTIIGIILSVAMITAVTTTVSSLQDFMLRVLKESNGSWHGTFSDVQEEHVEKIAKKKEVEKSAALGNVGYAELEDSQNEYRPYLYVGAYRGNFPELLSVHMSEGWLPKDSTEIIIPKELQDSGGIPYKVGDVLELGMGIRQSEEGNILWQSDDFKGERAVPQKFVETEKKTYTVVGRYTSASFESRIAPGFTALTKFDKQVVTHGETLWVTVHEPENINEFLKKNEKYAAKTDTNSMYLAYMGKSSNDNLMKSMIWLMSILIGIIMFGSVSLIANSFSISVNERKKQYGILSSVGATKKQLRKSVVFEAVILSVIGIPLGILAGLGGMAVTFYCLQDTFACFFNHGGITSGIHLQLSASVFSIILAAVLGFITILISAYLPARKALKVSAIEVIRQSDDIKVKPKKLHTWALTGKLFGIGGVLASKNFKRNKRKYRATVFSLFISIVLFISSSSFCDYMQNSLSEIVDDYQCDLNYHTDDLSLEQSLYPALAKAEGVTESSYHIVNSGMLSTLFDSSEISAEHKEATGMTGKIQDIFSKVVFIEDSIYQKYLEENGYSTLEFMNKEKPTALAIDRVSMFTRNAGSYNIHNILKSGTTSFDTILLEEKEEKERTEEEQRAGYESYSLEYGDDAIKIDENGKYVCRMMKYNYKKMEDGSTEGYPVAGTEKYVPIEEGYHVANIHVGAVTDEPPLGVDLYMGNELIFLYPRSAFGNIFDTTDNCEIQMYFSSDTPEATYQKMCTMLSQRKLSTDGLYNVADMVNTSRALMTVIRVFSYGFIALISLIAAANVFNTISTNISLRRREFAMLRSVGMTQKGFNRMMNYECILYGIKGILLGVPVAIGVTFLIYYGLSGSIVQGFYVPWHSVVIAVGSVFVVVFATMLYSMSKIRKDNVVETLKDENY